MCVCVCRLQFSTLVFFFLFFYLDVGCVQVGSHPEEGAESKASHDAALRSETAQSPDQIPGTSVEEEQHEDDVSHLSKGPTSSQ